MVRRIGLVVEKKYSQKVLNGTWVPPTRLNEDTKDILLIRKKNPTINSLGDIKVEITRESFRFHLEES